MAKLRHRARDRCLAAEEHPGVACFERRQPAERRTLELAVPVRAVRDHAFAFEPLPQAGGELGFEVVGIGKALIAGDVVSLLAFGPAFPDRLQEFILLELLADALGVVDDRRGLAEQKDVGRAGLLAAHVDRGFELEHRPAFVGGAVGAPPDRGIELEAGPLPHDAEHHVGRGHVAERAVDRFLEGMRRGVERVLPAQHLEPDDAFELCVEPVGHELDAAALGERRPTATTRKCVKSAQPRQSLRSAPQRFLRCLCNDCKGAMTPVGMHRGAGVRRLVR